MADDPIVIRRAETPADYRACQRAQRLAWGIADEGYVVPIATMVGAHLHGGLVLGAFLPDGEAVGVSFAFLGRIDGRLCLYSQLTGVVPGRQSGGLGYRLKSAQREHALADGIDRIAWAFDPLQAGNARFNLDKLGATVERYVDNMYGPRTDALNAGVPTDRVIAEWELSTPGGSKPAIGNVLEVPALIESTTRPDGLRTPTRVMVPKARESTLEIPQDVAGMRSRQPALAEEWRKAVRQGLTQAFDAGYRAT